MVMNVEYEHSHGSAANNGTSQRAHMLLDLSVTALISLLHGSKPVISLTPFLDVGDVEEGVESEDYGEGGGYGGFDEEVVGYAGVGGVFGQHVGGCKVGFDEGYAALFSKLASWYRASEGGGGEG